MGIVGMLIFIPIVSVVYALFREIVYLKLKQKKLDREILSRGKKLAVVRVPLQKGTPQPFSFPDNSFDVVISNTVSEHIEPSKFYGEQNAGVKT